MPRSPSDPRPPAPDPAPDDPSRPLLALSGGGARCFAQLGALETLLEAGVEPAAASASSSSAFIAALWAAGMPPGRASEVLQGAVPAMLRDVELHEGLLGHDGLERALAPHLPERFEELERPVAVVAIDMERGERVVFDSGPLLPALLASNAFPGLFVPVRLDGRVLVDGGGIEMVPVRSAEERWPGPVLAVDVSPPRGYALPPDGEGLPAPLDRLVDATVRLAALGWKSYVVAQSELIRYQLRAHPPRWLLRPDLPAGLGLLRFDRADEAFEAGRRAARELLPRLVGAGAP